MAMNPDLKANLMAFAHSVLTEHYGGFSLVKGQGVQRGKRVAFRENGKLLTCAIKLSTSGRIHFPREGDGWATLGQVERVLYVRPVPSAPDQLEAQMHSQETLLKAFDQNYAAALKRNEDHLPIWLNADVEEGARFIGSGFGKQALWRETTLRTSAPEKASLSNASSIIQDTKAALALALGIRPENIEILIRA